MMPYLWLGKYMHGIYIDKYQFVNVYGASKPAVVVDLSNWQANVVEK